jgi:hypothetical protein
MVNVSGECDATPGQTFTLSFSAQGPAFGPYPGTFTESGTVTAQVTGFIPPAFGFGIALTWSSNFTIDSPLGTVTGTKTLSTVFPSFASCWDGTLVQQLEDVPASVHY